MAGPLKGIKVIDFSHARAGPQATMMLGDMGADIIKIERPGGEMGRHWGPLYKGERIDFLSVNRNKRGIVLDFTNQDDLALAQDLIADADVLVQNLRPGVMASFGLGAEALCARYPRLIYCSINGYGGSGPLAEEPSYDNVIQAFSGWMSITGTDASGPVRSGLPLADLLTGVFATLGIVAALQERTRSGQGQHIQASLLQSLVNLLSFHGLDYLLTGQVPGLAGNHHPIMAPTGLFAAQDGPIVIQCSSQRDWERLCHALDLDAIVADPRFATNDARVANRPVLHEVLERRLAMRTRMGWIDMLREAKVAAGAVQTVGEALDSAQVRSNGFVTEMTHPRLGVIPALGFPVEFNRTPCEIRSAPPSLGEHTEAIRHARHF